MYSRWVGQTEEDTSNLDMLALTLGHGLPFSPKERGGASRWRNQGDPEARGRDLKVVSCRLKSLEEDDLATATPDVFG